MKCSPGTKATFHHAFEDVVDHLQAISELKSLSQVDRILSHGGSGALAARRARLATYAYAAAPEITIVAGGGMDPGAIALLKRTTTICEFHVGRAARRSFQVAGDVQADLVRALVHATREMQPVD